MLRSTPNGPGSVVGIATGYGLDGPGIESRWGGARFSAPAQTGLLYNGYRVFPEGKKRPGRDADPSPPSSAVVKKGYSYTSSPPMGRTACTEPQCLYNGALYLFFNLYRLYENPANVLVSGNRSRDGRHLQIKRRLKTKTFRNCGGENRTISVSTIITVVMVTAVINILTVALPIFPMVIVNTTATQS